MLLVEKKLRKIVKKLKYYKKKLKEADAADAGPRVTSQSQKVSLLTL